MFHYPFFEINELVFARRMTRNLATRDAGHVSFSSETEMLVVARPATLSFCGFGVDRNPAVLADAVYNLAGSLSGGLLARLRTTSVETCGSSKTLKFLLQIGISRNERRELYTQIDNRDYPKRNRNRRVPMKARTFILTE